ncbi:MAG: hypothetical protein PHY92_10400 [Alphaproteobacteria bacterium]|nr:hypothetical protein [Alphaproteobacteria bacterium]
MLSRELQSAHDSRHIQGWIVSDLSPRRPLNTIRFPDQTPQPTLDGYSIVALTEAAPNPAELQVRRYMVLRAAIENLLARHSKGSLKLNRTALDRLPALKRELGKRNSFVSMPKMLAVWNLLTPRQQKALVPDQDVRRLIDSPKSFVHQPQSRMRRKPRYFGSLRLSPAAPQKELIHIRGVAAMNMHEAMGAPIRPSAPRRRRDPLLELRAA